MKRLLLQCKYALRSFQGENAIDLPRYLFKPELLELEGRDNPAADVLTYHFDQQRVGANLEEVALTQANVNSASFGKLFSVSVDGQIYGQPLYKMNVAITSGDHQGVYNVVYIVTQNNSLYAFNADNGVQLWKVSYINPAAGVTTVPYAVLNSGNILPQVGITCTPVIDATTNTLYLSAATKEVVNGQNHYVQRLHAVDIGSGADKNVVTVGDTIYDGTNYTYVSGPSIAGTGDGSINGVLTFNALRQNQRAALTLHNGVVYLAYASHETNGPYHGWILGYNASDLQLAAVFNTSPNSGLGGIWQSGDGIAIDSQGFLYVLTGNGRFDTNLNGAGMPSDGSYGNSLLKIQVDSSTVANPNINGWGLKVVDYFTPFNQNFLDQFDVDLGSGGPMILPDAVGSPAHPHLIVFGGKQGTIYLVDRDNLGKYNPNTDNVVQVIPNAMNATYHTPAYFQNTVYFVGAKNNDTAKTYSISNASMSPVPTTTSTVTYGYPGAIPVVSANGAGDGIVWTVNTGTNALYAFDALGFNNPLYDSTQAANGRDALGPAQKFATPIVTNGRVYVGTSSALVVYGLLTPPTVVPKAPGALLATAISSSQIALSWTDDPDNYGANETSVDIEGSINGGPFTLIGSAEAHATIFSVGGLTPDTNYSFRIRARNGIGPSAYSNTAAATTEPSVGIGGVDFSGGFSGAGSSLALNGVPAVSGSTLRLTDGSPGANSSVFTTTKVEVEQFTSRFSFRQTNAIADGFTFTLQNTGTTALGQGGGGLGYGGGWSGGPGGIPHSAAIKFDLYDSQGEGPNSTGLYLNGAAPTYIGARDLTASGIDLHNGHLFNAVIVYDGTTLSLDLTDTVTQANVRTTWTVTLVSALGGSTAYVGFTGASGGYTATQEVFSWTYTPTALTAAPTGLNATPVSGTQINLAWTAPSGTVAGYKIERSVSGSAFSVIGTASGTNYSDTTLPPNTTAIYRVRATNSAGDSAASITATATTSLPPSTPSNPNATLVTSGEINLTWEDNAGNETGFIITRKTGSGTFSTIATLPPNTTAYSDTNLAPGTLYDYHISSFNSSGASDFTGISARTLPAGGGVNFSSGFAYTPGVLQFNGSAAINATALRLTSGGMGQVTSVFTKSTVGTTAFTSTFRMRPTSASADGLAFVLQNVSPTALGRGGGGLGYGAGWMGGTGGIANSVAIKFDLYNNQGEGANSTGLFINGAAPTLAGSIDLTPTGIDLHSGRAFDVTVAYKGTTLTVTITDVTTLATATQSYQVNLASQLGGTQAYAGFTASTGGLTAIQDILSWTYTPAPAVPANLTASAGAGQVTIQWSSSVGATGYNIYRGTTQAGQGPTPYIANYNSTSFTDTAVTSGVAYFYKIAAINGGGESDQSSEASAIPAGLNFSAGFAGSAGLLNLNGAAKISGTSLRLTDGGTGQIASAFTPTKYEIGKFATNFRFQPTNANADGFAFVIQGTAPTGLGQGGGGLGYGAGWRGGSGGIANSAAIKFDLYNNQGEGGNSTGLYLNGAAPTNANSFDLTPSGIDLHSGHAFDVAINYNGASLVVVITDVTTLVSATQTYAVNLASQVGGTTAYLGFTASTGGLTAIQDILSWTYAPIPPTPTGLTLTPGAGQFTLAWANSPGAAIYNVYRGTSPGGQGSVAYAANLLSPTFVDTGITSGVTYYYRVTAVNSVGESTTSIEVATVTPAINFAAGFASAGAGLTYSGRAGVSTPAVNGTRLRLTRGLANEATSVFTAAVVPVSNFTTQFDFQLTNANADGFTFALADSPTALGGFGGSLGFAGIPASIGIKFDLYSNNGEGANSTGLYLNGAVPTNAGSFDLTPYSIDLHSGRIFRVVIGYSGTTLTVKITDTVTNATATQTYALNIPAILGTTQAYAGFTAGTGGLTSTQDILNWTYAVL